VRPASLDDLGRWERHFWERGDLFREENAALVPEDETVVLLGDSLTEGWRRGERAGLYLPGGHLYLNRGITSDHILGDEIGLLRRMDESVFDCQPSHVFLLMGANDLARSWRTGQPPVERIFGGYRFAAENILAECPDATLCLVTTSPVGGRYEGMTDVVMAHNGLIRRFAAERDLPLIDLFALLADENEHMPESLSSDGLHFNDDGFRLLGQEIGRVLRENP
jgi:lysophospholipase L1-like esterase